MAMDLKAFQEINASRAVRWHHGDLGQWSLLEWCGAMCGEAGEAANNAKKLRRIELDLPNRTAGLHTKDEANLRYNIAKEIADSIIYGLVTLSAMGVDAEYVISQVFNQKSEDYGFPERAPINAKQ